MWWNRQFSQKSKIIKIALGFKVRGDGKEVGKKLIRGRKFRGSS